MVEVKSTSSARGKVAELLFLQVALEQGWDVALPVSEDAAYDVLVDEVGDGKFARVQVKRTWEKNGALVVNLVRSDGSRYRRTDCDYLAAVDPYTQRVWYLPWDTVYTYTRKRITSDMDVALLGEDYDGVPF